MQRQVRRVGNRFFLSTQLCARIAISKPILPRWPAYEHILLYSLKQAIQAERKIQEQQISS